MEDKYKKAISELFDSIRDQINSHSIIPDELARLVDTTLRNAGADFDTAEEIGRLLYYQYIFSSPSKIVVEVEQLSAKFRCSLSLIDPDGSTETIESHTFTNIADSKISREKQIKELFSHDFEVVPKMTRQLLALIKNRIQTSEYREYFK